jgi:N-dimethylarginine dimethylaminohydrolase
MHVWAVVLLLLALAVTTLNLITGAPIQLFLYDGILFLLALGILVRIRHKTREGEKEKLQQIIESSIASRAEE